MHLLVVDGNSIANRAFYGIRLLSTKDGRYTNAIVGFLNILQKVKEMSGADHLAIAFDVHAPTFRHQQFSEYKAGRKGMPEELRQQMPVLKQVLDLMGYTIVEKEGFEADDILGTLSRTAAQNGIPCSIVTGDRDALQLVDEGVTVLLPSTKAGQTETQIYTPDAILEKYGMPPRRLIDLKALMGDSSDNIPGVPGVGEKTAMDLLHTYTSLDNLYEKLESADMRDSLRKKLIAGKESAYMSYALGTICLDAPIDTDLTHYVVRPMQKQELAALLTELELFKWIEKLELHGTQLSFEDAVAEELPSIQVESESALQDCLEWVNRHKQLDFLYELSEGEFHTLYVAFGDRAAALPSSTTWLDIFEDASISKRTHDTKTLFSVLLKSGRKPAGFTMDTMLAAYLLDPLASTYSLPRLAQEYNAVNTVLPPDVSLSQQIVFFASTADKLAEKLDETNQRILLTDIELPLAEVLASMENIGFEVDAEHIRQYGEQLEACIHALETSIYAAVGYTFNLNSPKQLAVALFEDLGLPAKKKTKSGYSTNAEVLEELRDAHPAIGMLLEYRTYSKLKSTYCDGLLKVIGKDERIHSSFNQVETRTGRISSAEPNLQNIPVRQEAGRELRRFFRATEGMLLCDADYSQIELRVLASLAEDETMINAFNTGADIHTTTASQVFGMPIDMVTPEMRSRAKAVNFGIIYGIGAHSLSKDIGVSYKEAKAYIDGYFEKFSAVSGFMEELIEDAKQNGYAKTLLGRRRPLPELRAGNAMTRAFGERVARNMPIQGTAADVIKIAMVRVYNRLRAENMRARLILQVHDELIVEAPENEAEKAAYILKEEMERAVNMAVKLTVDVHTGKTWYDAKQ